MIKPILDFSHELLRKTVVKDDIVIDATAGNGNDTIFLRTLVGKNGRVLAFDVQEKAITVVKEKINQYNLTNTSVFLDSHANITDYIKEYEQIGGAIFNLGYLPGSDKSVITQPDSTIKAIHTMLNFLKVNGIIVVVIYHGHEGGKEEKDALLRYVTKLDQKLYNVLQYGFINQKNNPPFIIAIEKRK